jgi:hypothetical protein
VLVVAAVVQVQRAATLVLLLVEMVGLERLLLFLDHR